MGNCFARRHIQSRLSLWSRRVWSKLKRDDIEMLLQGFQKRQVLFLTHNVQYFTTSFARPFGHIFTSYKKSYFATKLLYLTIEHQTRIIEYHFNIFTRKVVYDLRDVKNVFFDDKHYFPKSSSGIDNIRICMCSIISLLTIDHITHVRSRLETEPHFSIFISVFVAIASGEFHSPYFIRFGLRFGGEYMLNYFPHAI